MIDYSEPHKPSSDRFYKYEIQLVVEHGDADFKTTEKMQYTADGKEHFEKDLELIFKMMKFLPGDGYSGRGRYCQSRKERNLVECVRQIYPDEAYPRDILMDILPQDRRYRSDGYYPEIQEVNVFVDNERRQAMDMDARETNIITLPEIGSVYHGNMGELRGTGEPWDKSYNYYTLKKLGIPMYEFEGDDDTPPIYTPITFTVVDIKLGNVYWAYDEYFILLKVDKSSVEFPERLQGFDQLDDIKPSGDLFSVKTMYGYDPNYKRN